LYDCGVALNCAVNGYDPRSLRLQSLPHIALVT
jgi:hypothetical protein